VYTSLDGFKGIFDLEHVSVGTGGRSDKGPGAPRGTHPTWRLHSISKNPKRDSSRAALPESARSYPEAIVDDAGSRRPQWSWE